MFLLFWLFFLACTAGIAQRAEAAVNFDECLHTLRLEASKAGYSGYVVDEILGHLEPNDRVIELDRHQPEFSETFFEYYKRRVTAGRIEHGRKMLAEHRRLLQAIEKKYGVPAHYLLAFWGLETNYGRYLGKLDVLSSLATLACDRRRSAFFKTELFHALDLIDRQLVIPAQLRGSWAGAMGNMQFMPSVLLRYGIDGDGDSRIDIWNSVDDALMSAAHYLQRIGWKGDERWGRPVTLPDDFDFGAIRLDTYYPLSTWRKLGVRTVGGSRLPLYDMEGQLVLPYGHSGPAFLAYSNFKVILQWNRSRFYALCVGMLADSIAGRSTFDVTKYPAFPPLAITKLRSLQEHLTAAGYEAGPADGIIGAQTRRAVRLYQLDNNMIADGYPDEKLFRHLQD